MMFNDKTKWNPIELRQGDVLAGVPFAFTSVLQHHFLGGLGINGHSDFPQLLAKMHGLSPESNDKTFFTGQVPLKLSFCAVMTQCCELVCNPKGKLKFVHAVSLCRLIPLNPAMRSSQEKLTAIQTNPDIRKGQGYKNYFYYGAPAELGGKEELMADFSQTTCIPSREFPEALSLRVLQLDDRARMKFKLKLGFYNASCPYQKLYPCGFSGVSEGEIRMGLRPKIPEMPLPHEIWRVPDVGRQASAGTDSVCGGPIRSL